MSDFDFERTTGNNNNQQQGSTQEQSSEALDSLFDQRETAAGNAVNTAIIEVNEAFQEAAKRVKGDDVKFVNIEHSSLKISAIGIAKTVGDVTRVYSLLLEDEASRSGLLEPKQKNFGMKDQIKIDAPSSNYYDNIMVSVIRSTVSAELKVELDSVRAFAYAVIPAEVNKTDVDAIAGYYDEAVFALKSSVALDNGQPTSKINAAMLNGTQIIAKATIDPNSANMNVFGTPYHSDLSVDLMVRRQTQQGDNTSPHNTATEETCIGQASAYINYAFMGDKITMEQNRLKGIQPMAGQPLLSPGYVPILTISDTTVVGVSKKVQDTLLTQLLSIASISATIAGNNWMQVHTTHKSSKPSVGLFGTEYSLNREEGAMKKFEGKAIALTTDAKPGAKAVDPVVVLSQYVYPTQIVAMEVTDGSPLYWVQSAFVSAAESGVPTSRAAESIHAELDKFSGGLWSSIFDKNTSIFAEKPTRSQTGYYPEGDIVRSLSSIDYLQMLQITGGDAQRMGAYSALTSPGTNNLDQLHEKRQITSSVTSGHAVYTGMKTTLYFNIQFIQGLINMFSKLRLNIQVEGIQSIAIEEARQATFNIGTAGGINSGTFQQNAFHQQAPQQNTGGFSVTGMFS